MTLKLGSTFYRISPHKDYFTKEKIYMYNKEAFISENTFCDCYVEEGREQLYFEDEHKTWCRTFKEAKELCNAKKVRKHDDEYWEVEEWKHQH